MRFDDFEIDLARLELRRAGRPISLPRQPAALLAHLVRHSGRVVTRSELQELLWPDKVVELDSGLNSCIRQIRQALGDSATEPRYIETIPRIGYRFRAEPARARTSSRGWRPVVAAVGLAMVALLAALTLSPRSRRPPPVDRYAVLPFEVLDERVGPGFADGLRVELTHRLSESVPAPHVVLPAAETERFRHSTAPLYRVAAELNATYLITGSVRDDGERLRVLLSVVEVATQAEVWSGAFEQEHGDPIAAQSSIATTAVPLLLSRP